MVTDTIADMLTRIRNAISAKHEKVAVPASKMKNEIAKILLSEGYIAAIGNEEVGSKKNIILTLKYVNGVSVISGLKRISKPGLRIYAGSEELPKVLNGLGIAIVSTNKGIYTDKQARQNSVGGEVLAYVW